MVRRQAIDQFAWGRTALHFAGISVAEHEGLARKLGVGAAGEVLLLVIAQECGANRCKWLQASDLGIPWQAKRWTSLTGLQGAYNDAVAKAQKLDSFDEDVALSGSSARDLPPAPCADPQPALTLRLRGPTAETEKEPETELEAGSATASMCRLSPSPVYTGRSILFA